eukprot:7954054-Pyramimonas_sp.AAC.2
MSSVLHRRNVGVGAAGDQTILKTLTRNSNAARALSSTCKHIAETYDTFVSYPIVNSLSIVRALNSWCSLRLHVHAPVYRSSIVLRRSDAARRQFRAYRQLGLGVKAKASAQTKAIINKPDNLAVQRHVVQHHDEDLPHVSPQVLPNPEIVKVVELTQQDPPHEEVVARVPSIQVPAGGDVVPGKGTFWSQTDIDETREHKRPEATITPCNPAQNVPDPLNQGRPLNKVASLFRNDPAKCRELGLEELCHALRKLAVDDEVLVVIGNENVLPVLAPFIDATRQATMSNMLVVALDQETEGFLQAIGLPHFRLRTPGIDPNSAKWLMARDILSVGCAVLLADPTVVFKQNAFAYLFRDSDVETMSLSSREMSRLIKGKVVGIDDAAMGWSRYVTIFVASYPLEEYFYPNPQGLYGSKCTYRQNPNSGFLTCAKDDKP